MRAANIGPDPRLIGLDKNFFPQTSGDRIFFLTYNTVIFFFQHYAP